MSSFDSEDLMSAARDRTGILLNGAHHARELTSISMNLYTILQLLYGVVQYDSTILYLLKNTSIYAIPIVNYDGY